MRAARADVDLEAVAHNIRVLGEHVAPAEVCAVVKADGYGHGAIAVGQAALEAGAAWLAVALIEEGAVLRKAGINAPILLLSQPRIDDFDMAVHYDLSLAVYTQEGIEAAADAATANGRSARVHLKVNTGMNRVDAHPDKVFQGEVAQVRLNAMMTQNVVTYTVVVAADNTEGLLLPYLTANVDIEVDRRKNVLVVPNSALRWEPEREQILPEYREAAPPNESTSAEPAAKANRGTVWVAEGGHVRPVRVHTGLSDGSRTEISGNGLSENVQVVVGVDQAQSAGGQGNPFIPQLPGKKKP